MSQDGDLIGIIITTSSSFMKFTGQKQKNKTRIMQQTFQSFLFLSSTQQDDRYDTSRG
jgi:hypothetical protein